MTPLIRLQINRSPEPAKAPATSRALAPALAACFLWGAASSARPADATFLPASTGEVARYRLTYHGEGTMNLRALMGQQSDGAPDKMASDLQARMEVVQVTSTTLALRLLAPSYHLSVNGQTPDLSREVATLENPCYLTVDKAGRVTSLSFSPQTPAAARTLLRSVISGLQFARPEGSARRWQVLQDTANGQARVTYRAVGGEIAGVGAFEKRIVDYPLNRQIGPKGDPSLHHVTDGALRFSFAQDRFPRLMSVDGTLTTRSSVIGRFVSEARERFVVRRIGGGYEPAATLQQWDAERRARLPIEAPTPLTTPDRDDAAQSASWRQVLGDATLESLLRDLKALDASGARNDPTLYSRLCALLSLQPKAAQGLADGIAGFGTATISTPAPGTMSVPMSVRLAGAALGAVASQPSCVPNTAEAAEGALREMVAARRDQPDAVLVLAPALASARAPRAETLRLLQALSQVHDTDTAVASILALGRLARTCPPALSRTVVRSLVERLRTPSSGNAALTQPILAALGNAGSTEGFAAVAAYTRPPITPPLRSVAYLSLRFVPGPRPMALLLGPGLSDPDAVVRLSAARALQFRPFSASDLSKVAHALAGERDASVRLALLENVHLEAPYYPQVARTILKRARDKDASPDIRQSVAAWISP